MLIPFHWQEKEAKFKQMDLQQDKTDSDDLNGGSGGYIYIKTSETIHNSNFDTNSTIKAIGGFG